MAERNIFAEMFKTLTAPSLQLVAVMDRGKANQERIYLRTHRRVDLGEYLLLIGIHLGPAGVFPLRDHVYWFGKHTVEAGYWIIVYTGAGQEPLHTQTSDTREPAMVFHWGKPQTIFNDLRIEPCLIHMDIAGIQILNAMPPA